MLATILEAADRRAEQADKDVSLFRSLASKQDDTRGFSDALSRGQFGVVAEIKRRSPSVGVIDADLDPVLQALAYEAGGAAAISVLTEPDFFGGSLDDLVAVRAAVTIPVLRKDFTRNSAQLLEARAYGADAALLIVAALTQNRLVELRNAAADIGIDVIVEVHTAQELERALAADATLIGVNNRNLATFTTDLSVAESLASMIPSGVVSIAESGVSDVSGAGRMREAGYDAVLVGEALVRAEDPEAFLQSLRGEQ